MSKELASIFSLRPHEVDTQPEADTQVSRRVALGLTRTIGVKELHPSLSEVHKQRYAEDLRRLKDRDPSTAYVSEATLSKN